MRNEESVVLGTTDEATRITFNKSSSGNSWSMNTIDQGNRTQSHRCRSAACSRQPPFCAAKTVPTALVPQLQLPNP